MAIVAASRNRQLMERICLGLSYEGLIIKVAEGKINDVFWKQLAFSYDSVIWLITEDTELKDFSVLIENFKKVYIVVSEARFIDINNPHQNVQYLSLPINYRTVADEIRKYEYTKITSEERLIKYKDIVLDLDLWEARIGNAVIDIRNKDFVLLKYFMENSGRLLTRMNIIENVWDINSNVITNTVDVHISNLRRIFKKHKETKNILQTVHSVGYIFK